MPSGATCRNSGSCSRRSPDPPRPSALPIGTTTQRASARPTVNRMHAENSTIQSLARALQAREITSEAVPEACLAQIAEENPTLESFITLPATHATAQAHESDRGIDAG